MYRRYSYAKPQRASVRRGNSFLNEAINSPMFPGQNVVYGNLSGVGAWSDVFSTIASTVKTAAETALPAYQAYALNKINLDRAKAGLPAIDPSQYSPSLNVQVQPDANTLRLAGGIGIGTLALGGLALFLLMRRRK